MAKALVTIILAAGKGTRMKSEMPKVLLPLGGKPLLSYTITLAQRMGSGKVIVVVGYGAQRVREWFSAEHIVFVEQTEQLGTGHAVLTAEEYLNNFDGEVLILCGDVPLLRPETAADFLNHHRTSGAKVTVMTTVLLEPGNYGRIVRDERGQVVKIVEARDASPEELAVKEINTGIYCADASFLRVALRHITNDNAQREYYLTDIMMIAHSQGEKMGAYVVSDPTEVMGINTPEELKEAEYALKRRIPC